MKTAEEITKYLETELAEAYAKHSEAKGKDVDQAFASIVKVAIIEEILEDIK